MQKDIIRKRERVSNMTDETELEEASLKKWITAPSRKKALASKMRDHAQNITGILAGKKDTKYAKANDVVRRISSDEDEMKDPTGHSSSVNNRPVRSTDANSLASKMRNKLIKKYADKSTHEFERSQKWWKKADKLDPLEENLKPSQKAVKHLIDKEAEKNSSASGDDFQPTKRSIKLVRKLKEDQIDESAKTTFRKIARAISKATGHQRRSLNKKAYKQWWSKKRPYERKNDPITRVKATQNPKNERHDSYAEKHGIRHSWTPAYKKSKYLGLKEGSIKDLMTKDQEEKRLLRTKKPIKVLSDKDRLKLKELEKKKIDEQNAAHGIKEGVISNIKNRWNGRREKVELKAGSRAFANNLKATAAYNAATRSFLRSITDNNNDGERFHMKGEKYSKIGDLMMSRYKDLGKTKNYMKGKK